MDPYREKYLSKAGFLDLVPIEAQRSVRALIRDVETCARQARQAAEHTRKARLDAEDLEAIGRSERAYLARKSATVDHRAACERLSALAGACRRLLLYAALDWRPDLDVAGSGLIEDELARLVALVGSREDVREVLHRGA